jgi:hypothetical protein
MANGPKLLLVRHGAGRGRFVNYANAWIQRARHHRPELSRRLVIHETGNAPPSLDGVGAVIFLLADPLRERYPRCYEEAVRIAEGARGRGIRVLNSPQALSNTIKSIQARIWRAAGVPSAACASYANRGELEAAVRQVPFPAIVRPDLLHAQEFTFTCTTPEEASGLDETRLRYPGVVLQFVDTRSGWDRTAPGSVWERYYHRLRAYVFGDRVLPQAIYFSEDPIVSSKTSTFHAYRRWGVLPSAFLPVPPLVRQTVHEDIRFANGSPDAPETMVRAVQTLGLDVAAVDYARLGDGSLVLWEANPHPAIPSWRHMELPVARNLRSRGLRLSDAALDFLERVALS